METILQQVQFHEVKPIRRALLALSVALLFFSCTNEPYESGDSRYSYLRTDFVEAHTDSQGQVTWVNADNGDMMYLSPKLGVSWASTPDTVFRGLLYYNVDKDYNETYMRTAESMPTHSVEPLAMGRVYVLNPVPYSENISVITDPVHFQSAWLSRNRFYVNLDIALMTGVADSIDAQQSIGVVCDSVAPYGALNHIYYFRLMHSQGGVPQYYKSSVYVSIPVKGMEVGDVVRISINSYDGEVTRTFEL